MSQVPLSEKKEGGSGRRRRRSRRKSANGADFRPWAQGDHDAVERALARFNQSPPPMGIPETIDPAPREKQLKWHLMQFRKISKRKWVTSSVNLVNLASFLKKESPK